MRRFMRYFVWLFLLLLILYLGWDAYRRFMLPPVVPPQIIIPPPVIKPPEPPHVLEPKPPAHVRNLLDSVYQQVEVTRGYDPAYVNLKYPGGDVPESTGVCADVIVRAFRAQGVDLQQALHEDMRKAFGEYPRKWSLKKPDTNIDHRRVYNLMRFFERQGKSLPITQNPADYQPGDVVAWDLGKGQAHIGLVTHYVTPDGRPLMGHNIAYGTNIEDALFFWPIIGHYRYFSQ
ncbi:DUF1287 domain-containing protein [Thiothrix lacustris]|uniref:DUF1287 domain-containing protein n=1 Tax=Thiothrix lacustris TaxID=525917 RepID=UPI000A49655E|nr:DUF1287 domain-containing protein [Thiothrix lacustris]